MAFKCNGTGLNCNRIGRGSTFRLIQREIVAFRCNGTGLDCNGIGRGSAFGLVQREIVAFRCNGTGLKCNKIGPKCYSILPRVGRNPSTSILLYLSIL